MRYILSILKHKSPQLLWVPKTGPRSQRSPFVMAEGDDFGVGKPRVQLGVQYEGKVNVLGKLLGRNVCKQFCLFVYASRE